MLVRKYFFFILINCLPFCIITIAKAQQSVNKNDTIQPAFVTDTSKNKGIKSHNDIGSSATTKDTFFLAKKRGLLGRLGRSIATEPTPETVEKTVNPYLGYAGKTIKSIEYLSIGFDRNINDTTLIKRDIGERIADAFHRKTRPAIIQHNLLFREGDKVFPYLLADNERLLRQQPFLEDARILLILDPENKGAVDLIVVTKDVFSISANVDIADITGRGRIELKDENFAGTGSRVMGGVYYDKLRSPKTGYVGELLRRNLKGSFIDWDLYYNNFNGTFNGSGNEEVNIYSNFDKPLLSEYMHWTGGLGINYRQNINAFVTDTVFNKLYKYNYYNIDMWYGYNIGSKKLLYTNKETRYHKFIALRAINKQFQSHPDSILQYHYAYVSTKAILGEISLFRQNFYKTRFIYGFGLPEDVPEGLSVSLIGGWANQSGFNPLGDKHERSAAYFGLTSEITSFTRKKSFYDLTFRIGGYDANNNFEDAGLLINLQHFTKLKKMANNWYNRFFVNIGFAKQFNPDTLLTAPLILQGQYGLPYYNYSSAILPTQVRTTIKLEADFYNNVKHAGFKFAPFAFSDMSLLTPYGKDYLQSDIYSAVGLGVRARNDNLVFGTIQVKLYYFLHNITIPGMMSIYPDVSTNPIFRYNSTFITKPDFVVEN